MAPSLKTGPEPDRDGEVVILVTGSRKLESTEVVHRALLDGVRACTPLGASMRTHPLRCMTLRHGAAPGLDSVAAKLAKRWGMRVDPVPADWTAPCGDQCRPGHRRVRGDGSDYCPAQGNFRNQAMIDKLPRPTLTLAFLIGESRGTRDCASRAQQAGIPVFFYDCG